MGKPRPCLIEEEEEEDYLSFKAKELSVMAIEVCRLCPEDQELGILKDMIGKALSNVYEDGYIQCLYEEYPGLPT